MCRNIAVVMDSGDLKDDIDGKVRGSRGSGYFGRDISVGKLYLRQANHFMNR